MPKSTVGKGLTLKLRGQVRVAYKGLKGSANETTLLVNDYITRRTLAKLGVTFNGDDISYFEAQYLTYIHSEWTKLENDEMKKQNKANKSSRIGRK